MALGLETIAQWPAGEGYQHIVEIEFDDEYPTGGEALTDGDIRKLTPGVVKGLKVVQAFLPVVDNSGRYMALDITNKKVEVYDPDSEVANAADLEGVKLRAFVIYRP